jgi:hypothetical protein
VIEQEGSIMADDVKKTGGGEGQPVDVEAGLGEGVGEGGEQGEDMGEAPPLEDQVAQGEDQKIPAPLDDKSVPIPTVPAIRSEQPDGIVIEQEGSVVADDETKVADEGPMVEGNGVGGVQGDERGEVVGPPDDGQDTEVVGPPDDGRDTEESAISPTPTAGPSFVESAARLVLGHWAASGMDLRAFCEMHQIPRDDIQHWQQQLMRQKWEFPEPPPLALRAAAIHSGVSEDELLESGARGDTEICVKPQGWLASSLAQYVVGDEVVAGRVHWEEDPRAGRTWLRDLARLEPDDIARLRSGEDAVLVSRLDAKRPIPGVPVDEAQGTDMARWHLDTPVSIARWQLLVRWPEVETFGGRIARGGVPVYVDDERMRDGTTHEAQRGIAQKDDTPPQDSAPGFDGSTRDAARAIAAVDSEMAVSAVPPAANEDERSPLVQKRRDALLGVLAQMYCWARTGRNAPTISADLRNVVDEKTFFFKGTGAIRITPLARTIEQWIMETTGAKPPAGLREDGSRSRLDDALSVDGKEPARVLAEHAATDPAFEATVERDLSNAEERAKQVLPRRGKAE